MPSSPEEPVQRPRRRLRPVLRAVLAGLVALEVVYVVAGVALVKSGQVGRWINKNPRKLLITFDSVWPIVPGVVRVRGFRIVNQGRGDQLEGKVDRVWGAVNPFELLARRVHVVWLRCEGVEFRLRKRPKTAGEAASLPAGLPTIDGVSWEPYAGPPPGAKAKKKAGMTIVFTRSRLDDVRDVWIGPRRIRGNGVVVASVTVFGGGPIAIPHADVRFEKARIENGTEETYSGVKLGVLGRLARYDPKTTKGLGILSLVEARVDVEARMPAGAGYLNAYLRNAPWIRFSGGEAEISAHLSVESGRLAPGGWIELSSSDRQAELAGFKVHGKARTRLDVVPAASGAADARLVVEFDRYDLRRGKGEPEPLLEGEGLRIVATTPASLARIPPTEFAGRLELGRAVFPRLDFVNGLLPAGGGLKVRGGRATVVGAFDVAGSGSSCSGSMTVATDGLSLDTGGVQMKGAFELLLTVPRGDLLKRTFDVDGMRIALDRFTFASRNETATAPDWSASVAFPRAHLSMGDAFAVRGRMELRASDSRPVAAFLSKNKPLAGWKKKLVTVGEIRGGSLFSLSGGTLEVDDFSVGWEGTEVKARFRTTPTGPRGKALVRVGILKAGISLEGKERDLHLVRPTHWYEER